MQYNRVNWQNGSSGDTPIDQTNLNIMDKGIDDIFKFLTTVPTNSQTLIVVFSNKFNYSNIMYSVQTNPIYVPYNLTDYQINCTSGNVYTSSGLISLTNEQLATLSINKSGNYYSVICNNNDVCDILKNNAVQLTFSFVETNSQG